MIKMNIKRYNDFINEGFFDRFKSDDKINYDFRSKVFIKLTSKSGEMQKSEIAEDILNAFYDFGFDTTECMYSKDKYKIQTIFTETLKKLTKSELISKLESIIRIVNDSSSSVNYNSYFKGFSDYVATISFTIDSDTLKELIEYLEL